MGMTKDTLILLAAFSTMHAEAYAAGLKSDIRPVVSIDVGVTVGQMRAVPVNLAENGEAVLLVYGEDATVDPYIAMFFFPKSTLKMLLFDRDGRVIWRKELNRGVIPGEWFCPVFPFDLDNDGTDEIWYVDNSDPDHPLNILNYKLTRLDAATGESIGSWDWPAPDINQRSSHLFRNFILGGHVNGEPVLVTAQGTYGPIRLQGWNGDMTPRWQHEISGDTPGARGSHMCPVIDIDGDGVEEFFWGERLIEMDKGTQVFCADEQEWQNHSDVIQPALDTQTGLWSIYTCREGLNDKPPRVVLFDHQGQRVWSEIEKGHMDMGWVARLGEAGRKVAMAIRIGEKPPDPQGSRAAGWRSSPGTS